MMIVCRYCSRVGEEEGPVCDHGSDIIRTDHWSCCGVGTHQAACTKVRLVWWLGFHKVLSVPSPYPQPATVVRILVALLLSLQPGGIHHFKGTGSGADKYYCARVLGVDLIPGSDGQCGPNNGPQCAECRAYQAAQVGR